jgi:hypothetical protein
MLKLLVYINGGNVKRKHRASYLGTAVGHDNPDASYNHHSATTSPYNSAPAKMTIMKRCKNKIV